MVALEHILGVPGWDADVVTRWVMAVEPDKIPATIDFLTAELERNTRGPKSGAAIGTLRAMLYHRRDGWGAEQFRAHAEQWGELFAS
jgi:hypothetical protein